MNFKDQPKGIQALARLAAFFDPSAWILFVVAFVPLILVDTAMAKTLGQWTVYSLALAGLTVVITRLVLPQVSLDDFLTRAREGNVAAGLVVLSLGLFLSATFLGLVLWSKV